MAQGPLPYLECLQLQEVLGALEEMDCPFGERDV